MKFASYLKGEFTERNGGEAQVDEVIKRLQAMKDKLPTDVDWKF